MVFDQIWNYFTYIFRLFKIDRTPEYIKNQYIQNLVNNFDNDSDEEIGYIEFNETKMKTYEFVIIRD
jgi:hypothetical protein